MDAAECIGCGACVAACPNASAMLFVAAKVAHLASCRRVSRSGATRVVEWSRSMTREGFGNCTNNYECEAACPKEIGIDVIAKLNRDYLLATTGGRRRHVA